MEESRIMARNAEGNMENYDGRPCVAAMDLGTNSNRLLIADTAGNAVYRDVKHVALGEGLAESGKFCPAGDGTRHLFVYGFCGDAKAL